MNEQTTSGRVGPVQTNGGRQCSGCHRRGAQLTLFENGKLYCASCGTSVVRLGIERVVRDDEPAVIAEPGDQSDALDQPDDEHEDDNAESEHDDDNAESEHEDDNAESEEEHVMANEPRPTEEIAVMPPLAAPVPEPAPNAPAPTPGSDVSLEGVLGAERARLLEQRAELERRFRTDVESIDARLLHVESLLGEQPGSLAS